MRRPRGRLYHQEDLHVAYRIPFHQETFIPESSIAENRSNDRPVAFELSMAAGPDHARLKSILFATMGLLNTGETGWSPEMQAAVAEAFRNGPQLFTNTVGRIDNLTAPAALCRRLSMPISDKAKDEDDIPITDGYQFAKVAPYMPSLALEVA